MSLSLGQELMRDRDNLLVTIKKFKNRLDARRDIIAHLDGEEGRKKLQSIVKEAVNYALKKAVTTKFYYQKIKNILMLRLY
jgi:hypothetical protein